MEKNKIRVLLVEDDEYMNRILYDLMTRMGLTVDRCYYVGEVIEKTADKNVKYDVLVLDYLYDLRSRTVNGIELYEYLKRRMPRAKAVMVSSYANVNIKDKAAELGISVFLDKPFALKDFTVSLEKLIYENNKITA